jgi:hypothetical protein
MTIKPVIFPLNFKEKRKSIDRKVAMIKKRMNISFLLRILCRILLENFDNSRMNLSCMAIANKVRPIFKRTKLFDEKTIYPEIAGGITDPINKRNRAGRRMKAPFPKEATKGNRLRKESIKP